MAPGTASQLAASDLVHAERAPGKLYIKQIKILHVQEETAHNVESDIVVHGDDTVSVRQEDCEGGALSLGFLTCGRVCA